MSIHAIGGFTLISGLEPVSKAGLQNETEGFRGNHVESFVAQDEYDSKEVTGNGNQSVLAHLVLLFRG